MKKKIIITRRDCLDKPWSTNCGCPLYEKLIKNGFPVKAVYGKHWVDTLDQKHEFSKPFWDTDYAEVIISKKPFVIMVDDNL